MIYVLSGGGANLNFKIVGGTTQPANPKENTIWINTDVEITSYVFSATQPAGSEGMVWIRTATNSAGSFNALKKNDITVYPDYVKQFVSGSWVDKTTKINKSGTWVEVTSTKTIYDSDLGGALEPISVVATEKYATASVGANGIVFSYSSTGNDAQSVVITDGAHDLTNYKILRMEATISGLGQSNYQGRMVVNKTKWGIGGSQAASKGFSANNSKTTYDLDISALSGAYYIGTNGGLKGTIHRIALIK